MTYTDDELIDIYKKANNGSDKITTKNIFNAMRAIAEPEEKVHLNPNWPFHFKGLW